MTTYMPNTDCAAFNTNEKGQLRCEYLTEMLCMTRGKCKFYNPTYPKVDHPSVPRKTNKKKSFTDRAAFELWQKGMTDAQVAAILGVSRQMIQRWRDRLELPTLADTNLDAKKFRLVETQYGCYVVHEENDG